MAAIVVVGASLAGLRAAQGVRASGHDGELVLIGDEAHPPYTRPPLSKELLAGNKEPEGCRFDRADVDATWRTGERAVALDAERRTITLASGESLEYDRLVVATGSRARTWDGPGAELGGLYTLRGIDDALRLRSALAPGIRVAVAGAGFVGCEVAATARGIGAEVTLIDVAQHPIVPLGELAGARCRDLHAGHGVVLRLGVAITAFTGLSSLDAVVTADGRRFEATVGVVALGAVPNTDWLAESGLQLDSGGGIRCDATLTALGAPEVLCAGDVTSWPHPLAGGCDIRVEHWTNAAEQGSLAGRNAVLDHDARKPYDSVPYFWTDQYDVKLQSAGLPELADAIHVLEQDGERFVAVGERDGRAICAIAWNAPRRLMLYRRALAKGPTVGDLEAGLAGDDSALSRAVEAAG
jgi:3-phenylpropionate/trans-cinnamate dioxygenase ferredoxin reductase component